MRTGVLLPSPVAPAGDLVAWARAAEDAGFDCIGVRGRIVLDSLEPLVALSLVAAVTRRIGIVVHLDVSDGDRPRVLARQIAALDRASRGRVNIAVGTATWTFTDRHQDPRSLTVVDHTATDRAGADDVLLGVPSMDLRELERLATVRAPVLA